MRSTIAELIRHQRWWRGCGNRKSLQTVPSVLTIMGCLRVAPTQRAYIITRLYLDLVKYDKISENYLAEQIARADRVDGDIDTLSHRIAQTRTWTFVSHQTDWLADPHHRQEKHGKLKIDYQMHYMIG